MSSIKRFESVYTFFKYRPVLFYVTISACIQLLILFLWQLPQAGNEYFDQTELLEVIDITAPPESSQKVDEEIEITDDISDEPKEVSPKPLTKMTRSTFESFLSQYQVTSLPRPLGYPPKPKYPAAARNAQIEGTVIIMAAFDRNGRLILYKVMKSLGYGCNEAAIQALKATQFAPALKDGKPVPARMNIRYEFTFED